jgi:phosphoribosylaminoimidazolecarboxamide formyltransferase/IMP cyclohydrolase
MTITRALISVSDKTGLIPFARFLLQQKVEILSTGGTAELLRKNDIPVRDVSSITNFPEMMDGRVKTLHPGVHGGLLARRADAAHMASASAHNIPMIDLLVVNLYPFETTLNQVDSHQSPVVSKEKANDSRLTTHDSYDHLIENIDIGGPAMIRAAAKNHESVTVIVDVADYEMLQELLQHHKGEVPLAERKKFAAKAFARCASYDTLISSWLTSVVSPESLVVSKETVDSRLTTHDSFPAYLLDASLAQTLRYGENPHQAAALYQRLDGRGGIAHAEQLQGKELSYNNLADAHAAWEIVSHWEDPAAAIIKHANPCGAATYGDIVNAFSAALASDPTSAFGGILAVNREVTAALVNAIGSLFLEVIVAPGFSEEARTALAAKKNLRLLIATPETHASPLASWMIEAIGGGYLVQTQDKVVSRESLVVSKKEDAANWKLVTKSSRLTTHDSRLTDDAALAWHVAKHVKSNAIVLVKNGATIGVGAGQMSRVDSVRIAIEKARAHGHDPRGATLASDAFFPFADNVELAAEAGISRIIQPGGSVRDAEVIEAAKKHGIEMVFTGTRHFRH